MPIALAASCSDPEGRFQARRSAVSTLSSAPSVMFGRFRRSKLVRGLTFGAIK